MLHLHPSDQISVDQSVKGFVESLVAERVFPRQVDAVLYGCAYGIRNELQPIERLQRNDLIRVSQVDPEIILALELSAQRYAPGCTERLCDSKELLDFICRLGSAGVAALRERAIDRSAMQKKALICQLTLASTNQDNG